MGTRFSDSTGAFQLEPPGKFTVKSGKPGTGKNRNFSTETAWKFSGSGCTGEPGFHPWSLLLPWDIISNSLTSA